MDGTQGEDVERIPLSNKGASANGDEGDGGIYI
jgi:hypothetical protein